MGTTSPAFNDRGIKGLRAPAAGQVDHWDRGQGSQPGLGLRISYGNTRTWILRYRMGGQRRRLKLGTYPAMKLQDARIAAREALRQVQVLKLDPAASKKADKGAGTMAAVCREYLERYAKPRKRSWREDERIINRDIVPYLGAIKVREITRRQIRERITAILDRDAPIMANAVQALIHGVLRYATDEEMIDANPAAGMRKPAPKPTRDRVLTDSEVRELWIALSQSSAQAPRLADDRRATRLAPDLAAGMRLRLLTAQRGGEVFSMTWADLDMTTATWTIPAAIAKNGTATRVPLTRPVLAILEERRRASDPDSIYVFERLDSRGQRVHMSKLSRKAAHYLVHGRCPRKTPSRRRQEVGPGVSFSFTGHDLRRTAATLMARAGVTHEIIARVLNHTQAGPAATAVYNRWQHDAEKRQALEKLAAQLDMILNAPDSAAVLPFAQARA
jgi:integrase